MFSYSYIMGVGNWNLELSHVFQTMVLKTCGYNLLHLIGGIDRWPL